MEFEPQDSKVGLALVTPLSIKRAQVSILHLLHGKMGVPIVVPATCTIMKFPVHVRTKLRPQWTSSSSFVHK